MIPFAPPFINQEMIDEVSATLQSGWITTGPRTKKLEVEIAQYTQCKKVYCVNSATAGLELILRWFGVKEGDEVILPAYTYSATANVVMHVGATPVFVDVNEHDFNINYTKLISVINEKTKVIMPVDFAGLPCDYNSIMEIINQSKSKFKAENDIQNKLGRILLLSDAAHSFGAIYNNKKTGVLTDATVFSFHAVKNLTTAEGGAICLQLPDDFNSDEIYTWLNIASLHGQTKDALSKTKLGAWEYDIIMPGFKCNMPDVLAAIGLIGLKNYEQTLHHRKQVYTWYSQLLQSNDWAILPILQNNEKEGSAHLFPLRIKNITELQRNSIIIEMAENKIATNVHFKPLPLLSYYKNLGFKIDDYPIAYKNYASEISLPIHHAIDKEKALFICKTLVQVVNNHVK